ncbi:MAG: hypothetical protein NTY09_09330 [bacterium]|nr:hypothetical protein [bacterium]
MYYDNSIVPVKEKLRVYIPRWVRYIPALHNMYWNPVFQRRVIRKRLEPAIGSGHTFWTGVIISILTFGWGYTALANSSRTLNYIILSVLGVLIAIIAVRLFWVSVILTVNRMKDLLTEERKDPVLTTPLTDREIFYGECVGNVMKGHLVFEATVCFAFGLVAPYILILIILTLFLSIFFIFIGFAAIIGMLTLVIPIAWMVFMSVMILLLLAFSAGYYAILTDNTVAIMMAILHTALFTIIGSSLLFLPFFLADVTLLEPKQMLIGFGAGVLFQVCWMLISVYGTAWMGLRAFSLSRRPGFYEADKINAFDQA